MANEIELMTRSQVARLFQCSIPTILRWQKAGKLHAVKLGAGSIRYSRTDVEAFLERAGK